MTELCSGDNVSEEEEEEESEFEVESDSTEDSEYDMTMSEHTLNNSEDSSDEVDTRKPAARKNKR